MLIQPIQTRIFKVGDPFDQFLLDHLKEPKLQEGDVVAITSKIVSLAEGEIVKKSLMSKDDLVKIESDVYIGKTAYDCHLTVKHGLLIPSAGIDESNSEAGDYILYPKKPFVSAKRIWQLLTSYFNLSQLAIILTDSHTTPLRRGVSGIALAHFGFKGTTSLVGQPDLYGKNLKFTHINHADALAVMAVYVMGEAAESCPLATIRGASGLKFCETAAESDCTIPIAEDLYLPLLSALKLRQEASFAPC